MMSILKDPRRFHVGFILLMSVQPLWWLLLAARWLLLLDGDLWEGVHRALFALYPLIFSAAALYILLNPSRRNEVFDYGDKPKRLHLMSFVWMYVFLLFSRVMPFQLATLDLLSGGHLELDYVAVDKLATLAWIPLIIITALFALTVVSSEFSFSGKGIRSAARWVVRAAVVTFLLPGAAFVPRESAMSTYRATHEVSSFALSFAFYGGALLSLIAIRNRAHLYPPSQPPRPAPSRAPEVPHASSAAV